MVRLPGKEMNKYRLYLKGAPEVVLSLCRTRQVYSSAEENGEASGGSESERETYLNEVEKDYITQTVVRPFARKSLRTLAFAYKDYTIDVPTGPEDTSLAIDPMGDRDDEARAERERRHIEKVFGETVTPDDSGDASIVAEGSETYFRETGLCFLGLVAIEDPLRPTVKQAIQDCNR